jgi:hypothetical protein
LKLTTYTQNQKIEAIKLWLITGNLTQTAAALKIPYDTVKQWRYSKWWEDLALEIKAEGRMELSGKLKKVAEKALEITLDRLEHGDWQVLPTGEMIRKGVNAQVASKIATEFIEKAEVLDNRPVEGNLQSVQDKLKSIADTFQSFSKKVRRIEVEDIDVQEGSSLSPREGEVFNLIEGGTTSLPPREEQVLLPEEGRTA